MKPDLASSNRKKSPYQPLSEHLKAMTGEYITLYLMAGGKGLKISGILTAVYEEYVKIKSEKRIKHVLCPNPRNPVRKMLYKLKYGCSERILYIETVKICSLVKIESITAIISNPGKNPIP